MINYLIKKFMPKNAEPTSPAYRAAGGRMSGIVGMVCNVLLFAAKFMVGLLSGSVSVMADSMNNLSDASSALVTLIGFKLAERPADEDHPYGHARYEYLSGLAVAGIIVVIGFELAKTSVTKIFNPTPVELSVTMAAVLIGSILVKLWLALFNTRLGKAMDSAAILATAADSRNDVISTGAVLIAAVIEAVTDWRVDGFIGLAVAVFILYSGVTLAKETISPLLGESANPELQKQIVKIMKQEPAVLGYHDLMVHDYGPGQRFGSLHIEMDHKEDALRCHELIDNLERKCLKELGVHLVIHSDPVAVGDETLEEMRRVLQGALTREDPRLSLHDLRMVKGEGHTNLIFDVALPHDLAGREKALKKAMEKALAEKDQGVYYLVITFDRGTFAPEAFAD